MKTLDIDKKQETLDEVMAGLETGTGNIETDAPVLRETSCTGQPIGIEWLFAVDEDEDRLTPSRPARTTRKRIAFLKSLLEQPMSDEARAELEEALKNLTAKPASWVKQLEVQAQFEDCYDELKAVLEEVNHYVETARSLRRKDPENALTATKLVKELHPFAASLLEIMNEITCEKCSKTGVIAYATAEQKAFLEGAKLLFKRAKLSTQKASKSRSGSTYFYLMDHIESAGVLEEQDFYNPRKCSDVNTSSMTAEELKEFEARKYAYSLTLEPSNRFGTRGLPIDEYTVDIDETIVETD